MTSQSIFTSNRVLGQILTTIPFRTLLDFRLVAKRWNNVILNHPAFAPNCIVTVRGNPDVALKLFSQTPSNKSFRNFKFHCKSLKNETEVQVGFWQLKGFQIKSLNFQEHNLGPVTFLEILLACPNLEELSFNCSQIYKQINPFVGMTNFRTGQIYDDGQDHTPFQKLIPHLGMMKESGVLRKLKILNISGSNGMPSGILRDFLQWGGNLVSLHLMDKNGKHPRPQWDVRHIIQLAQTRAKYLTRLELTGTHILPEHILALAKIRDLRLRSVGFQCAQVTEKSLSHFFRKQKSLVELDLSFTQVSEKAFTHPSCTFQQLKKLNLSGFTDALEFLSFLSRMPLLEFINLSSSRSNTMTWDTLVSGFLPSRLRKLQCLDLSHNLSLGTFQKQSLFNNLVICIKQITCLNLSANVSIKDSFLQIIWRNMTALRVVFLEYLTTVTNEGIVGIRQAQVQGAEASGKLDVVEPALLRSQNKNASYIGDCPNIQVLSLAYATRLTDLSIQLGIKNLPRLQKLKLTGCGHISDRSIFFLATGCLNLAFLDISETLVSASWIDWAKSCLPDLKRVVTTENASGSGSVSQLAGAESAKPEMPPDSTKKDMDPSLEDYEEPMIHYEGGRRRRERDENNNFR